MYFLHLYISAKTFKTHFIHNNFHDHTRFLNSIKMIRDQEMDSFFLDRIKKIKNKKKSFFDNEKKRQE